MLLKVNKCTGWGRWLWTLVGLTLIFGIPLPAPLIPTALTVFSADQPHRIDWTILGIFLGEALLPLEDIAVSDMNQNLADLPQLLLPLTKPSEHGKKRYSVRDHPHMTSDRGGDQGQKQTRVRISC